MAWSKRVEKLLLAVADEHGISRQRILHTYPGRPDDQAYWARADLWYRLSKIPLPWGRQEGASANQIAMWFGYSDQSVRDHLAAWKREMEERRRMA